MLSVKYFKLHFLGAFYFYAGLALLGLIFIIIDLPETRGKSLEEVEGLFALPICCGAHGGGGGIHGNDSRPEPHNHTVQYVHIRGLNTRDRQDSNDSGDDTWKLQNSISS